MQSKAALAVAVDQLIAGWRGVGEDPQPGVGVGTFGTPQKRAGHLGPSESMKPIAGGDQLLFDLELSGIGVGADPRSLSVDIAQSHRLGLG